MIRILAVSLYFILSIFSYSFAAKASVPNDDMNFNLIAEYDVHDHGSYGNDDLNIKKLEKQCFKENVGKACSILASILYEENPKRSFEVYKRGCELKDPTSCYNVGDFYRVGDFVKKDEKKAIKYFKLACKYSLEKDKSYCGGCYLLGDYFLNKKDYKKAAIYYDKDCRNACCEACYKVEGLASKKLIPKNFFQSLRKKNSSSYEKCDLMNKLTQGLEFGD